MLIGREKNFIKIIKLNSNSACLEVRRNRFLCFSYSSTEFICAVSHSSITAEAYQINKMPWKVLGI